MANAFDRCIAEALKAKQISQAKADELRAQLDAHVAGGLTLSDEKRASLALDTLNALEADALRRKANAIRQVRANRWNTAEALAHPKGAIWGVVAKLVRDITGYARYGNVDSQGEILAKRFQGQVSDAIAAMRAKGFFGQKKNTALAEEVALHLRGSESSDPAVRGMAEAFKKVFEETRVLFNRAGGAIRSRADWGTPQWHDAGAVLRAGAARWKDSIRDLLDPDKMINQDGTPMSRADLEETLDAAFESITSTTLSRRGRSAANAHGDHRVLVFKDAESWLKYNRQFGEPDVFAGFVRHLDGLAKQIGQMQVLGPNPDAGVLALQQALMDHLGIKKLGPIREWIKSKGWNVNNPETAVRRLQGLWETVRGDSTTPGSIVQMGMAIRQLNVATKLGSASLSSMSDEAMMAHTALWNGISPIQVMKQELKQMSSEERRLFAIRLGIGWDSWTRRGIGQNRFAAEATGTGWAATFADATISASGLNVLTDARRAAFGMEFLGALGELAGKSLPEIRTENPKLAKALERYGIMDADWDGLRGSAVDFDGARYLHPQALIEGADNDVQARALADKLMRMVHEETDFAVPVPRAMERYLAAGGTLSGSARGEVFKHLFQFKTFAITMMTTHLGRGLHQQGARGKLGYMVPLSIMLTGAGAGVLQARALIFGRDPEDMDSFSFWGRAFTQGGGAGLIGDALQTGITGANRFGNTFLVSMSGPTAGMVEDAVKVGFQSLQGDTSVKGKLDFATRHLMPGSSLWYARLIVDREIKDQLLMLGDPASARRTFAGRDRFYRERGSKFWWQQGNALPDILRPGG